jgi:hypothetical protein
MTPGEIRKKEFEEFSKNSDKIFEKFKKAEKNTFFEDYYMLCVAPGGRNGGTDQELFEIFYGARPVGRKIKYKNNTVLDKGQIVDVIERGVTLLYQ